MTHLEPGQIRAEGLGRWFRLGRAGSTLRGTLLGYDGVQAREFLSKKVLAYQLLQIFLE